MTEPRSGEDIDGYLRQYRDRYTRDAMAAKLIEAGHDPAVVEAAVRRLEAEHTNAVESSVQAADAETAGARRVTRIIVLSVYALICLWIVAGLRFGPAIDIFQPANIAFIGLAVALGAVVYWLIGRSGSTAAMVAWSVVAIVIGLPVALFGACLVGLSSGVI